MLEVTGERLVPDQQRGELIHAEHLARYRFASQLGRGLDVLDAACGEGYGSAMLAAGGARVVGVDVDAQTVAHARQAYGLDFRVQDVCDLALEDDSFDLIVSFETIEHVEDASRMLAEFRRVLRPDGRLVISTPNSDQYTADNEFHTREFSTAEFVALIEERFPVAALLYQQNWLTSAVLDEHQHASADGESALAIEFTKVVAGEPGSELYAIAVCGPAPESLPDSVAVATGVYEGHQLVQLYEAWVERATEAERLVGAWNERATEAERQLEQAREKLAAIETSLSWRVTRPLRSAKQAVRRPGG